MFVVLAFIVGVIIGFIFKKVQKLHLFSGRASDYFVYVLIFLLGISVGTNPKIISNLKELGLTALVISLFATIGSIISAYIYERIVHEK